MRKRVYVLSMILLVVVVSGVMVWGHQTLSSEIIPVAWVSKGNNMQIMHQFLTDAHKEDWLAYEEALDVKLTHGDVTGDSKDDLIIVVSLQNQQSIIGIYKNCSTKLEYLGVVDYFYALTNVEILPVKDADNNILVVRELINQEGGRYEDSTFVRAYLYNNDQFNMVLSVREDYQTSWNMQWENPSEPQPRWICVQEKNEIQWEDSNMPVIRSKGKQIYMESREESQKDMPTIDQFHVVKEKDIEESYYWNPEYKHFIIEEAKERKTGEKVAIIEDFSQEPLTLAGYERKEYRIKHKDGTIQIIPCTQISRQKEVKPTFRFAHN